MELKSICCVLILYCLTATIAKTTIEAADEVLFILSGETTPQCSATVNELIPANASLYLRFNNVRVTGDAAISDLDITIRTESAVNFGTGTEVVINFVIQPDPSIRSCIIPTDVSYSTWNYISLGFDTKKSVSRISTSNSWDIPNSFLQDVVDQPSWKDLQSSFVVIIRPLSPATINDDAFWNVNARPYIEIDWTEPSPPTSSGINMSAYLVPIIFVTVIFLIVVCSVLKSRAWCFGSVTTKKTTTTTVVAPQTTVVPVHQPQPQQPVAYGTPMPAQPYGAQPSYPPQGQQIVQGYPPAQGPAIHQGYPPQGHAGPVVPPIAETPYAEDSPYQ